MSLLARTLLRHRHRHRHHHRRMDFSSEQQAIATLKLKLSEPHRSSPDLLPILIDSFRSHGVVPTQSAYAIVVGHALHRRLFSQLPPVLRNLEGSEEIHPPETLFTGIIRGYGRAGLLQEAVDVFFKMPSYGCAPTTDSLDSLLSALCRDPRGLAIVGDVVRRTNVRLQSSSFRILVRALCAQNAAGRAVELLQIMNSSHEYTPDSALYSSILVSLCAGAGDGSEVVAFMKEMVDAGFAPGRNEYEAVVDALVREGRAGDANAVLKRMVAAGLRSRKAFTRVLQGCLAAAADDDLVSADEVFDEMLLRGVPPGVEAYNAYVGCLCKQGEVERARRIVTCMGHAGCQPNEETYSILHAGFNDNGEMTKAGEVMDEMLKKKC